MPRGCGSLDDFHSERRRKRAASRFTWSLRRCAAAHAGTPRRKEEDDDEELEEVEKGGGGGGKRNQSPWPYLRPHRRRRNSLAHRLKINIATTTRTFFASRVSWLMVLRPGFFNTPPHVTQSHIYWCLYGRRLTLQSPCNDLCRRGRAGTRGDSNTSDYIAVMLRLI